jgi:hypothetical protein
MGVSGQHHTQDARFGWQIFKNIYEMVTIMMRGTELLGTYEACNENDSPWLLLFLLEKRWCNNTMQQTVQCIQSWEETRVKETLWC